MPVNEVENSFRILALARQSATGRSSSPIERPLTRKEPGPHCAAAPGVDRALFSYTSFYGIIVKVNSFEEYRNFAESVFMLVGIST